MHAISARQASNPFKQRQLTDLSGARIGAVGKPDRERIAQMTRRYWRSTSSLASMAKRDARAMWSEEVRRRGEPRSSGVLRAQRRICAVRPGSEELRGPALRARRGVAGVQ